MPIKATTSCCAPFARLRGEGMRIGMVCCRWGSNVPESLALLEELRVASDVKWVETMGMVQFERTAQACDVVADQFHLGAFGGIMLKAMAATAPVCTYLDEAAIRGRFPSVPPIINAYSEADIVVQLRRAFSSPARLQMLGKESRDWIKANYSARETLERQLCQFEHHRFD